MSEYPKLSASINQIGKNASALIDSCNYYGVKPVAVTKLVGSQPEVVEELVKNGITIVADSRLKNLKKIQNINVEKMLLRLPALSEADDVILYSNISLNSEFQSLVALSEAAIRHNRVHKVIVMHDLGDLREGSFKVETTLELASLAIRLVNIELIGIGANLACYGGVEPSSANQQELVNIAKQIEQRHDIKLSVISGASSAGLPLMMSGGLPDGVNQLRLGASILMGIGLNDEPVPGTSQNVFTLSAEIIEVKIKPSVPEHSSALDAFGNVPIFTDRGERKRAICAVGKQDVNFDELSPTDQKAIIIGGSSDHLIIDVDDCEFDYRVGDILEFELGYSGVLQCITSEYINKSFLV
ncbi:alanine/ornithine racemase family PLP-dependent enzyme [Vibrio sp. SCSIO 43137]|uniref:alanine/ornithine racemase family PLP-dependent enzyme n=1 Tax=Vibrio sp. SCSIO 43137 TaxID=3021011 RepID=UPI002307B294|nr:alanine/ornithine racemase family PLP-dependent enzyme [Vibrio sp. SCSIO 43137]WCE32306.1 alanine/ornithine racemase family PLP-dependent enzyme [Vibrio sp. SCSIO 43137]